MHPAIDQVPIEAERLVSSPVAAASKPRSHDHSRPVLLHHCRSLWSHYVRFLCLAQWWQSNDVLVLALLISHHPRHGRFVGRALQRIPFERRCHYMDLIRQPSKVCQDYELLHRMGLDRRQRLAFLVHCLRRRTAYLGVSNSIIRR